MTNQTYRPRNPGHDYYGVGVYLVTLVVSRREALLGQLGCKPTAPRVMLSPLGEAVQQAWEQLPEKQAEHGNRVTVHACVCMPDHFHGVIEVLEPMAWSLGDIMQTFKAVCTSLWQRLQGLPASVNRPISADCFSDEAPAWLREKALKCDSEGALIRTMSKRERREYYAMPGREHCPLFDENYDDTVCLNERHREAMIAYVNDNPRRAILRRALPDVMQRSLHVQIGERSYGAFGNLFLLRWANKIQVHCHRRHPDSGLPYEQTDDYARQHREWVSTIVGGGTAIVTPGISRGEQIMKNECLEKGYPLIHLQDTPVTPLWKPERKRFDACAHGSLLILAPWGLDEMRSVEGVPANSDYSRFHNLNTIAAEICAFTENARIIRKP